MEPFKMLLQIKKDKEEEGETPSLTRNCDSGSKPRSARASFALETSRMGKVSMPVLFRITT
jgi:hypothetical protein